GQTSSGPLNLDVPWPSTVLNLDLRWPSLPSGVDRRRLEPRALVPALHDVEALDAIGRTALAKVVDGRHAHRASRARIGHDRDIAVVGADDGARRRPLALVENPHEWLTGIELAIDLHEVGRR